MTSEDDPFIRKIVDSRGDDLPRLVYADWLDERDDPRGAYLRAELNAWHDGNTDEMQRVADGLNPVWVARVTRPPFGVCIEHAEVVDVGPQLDLEDIRVFESANGVSLPSCYVAFLLNYNGGYILHSILLTPDGEVVAADGGWKLSPLSKVGQHTLRSDDTLNHNPTVDFPALTEPVEAWISRHLVIGHDPDLIGGIFLATSGDETGSIRILDRSVEIELGIRYYGTQPPYANTFPEFLYSLPERRSS